MPRVSIIIPTFNRAAHISKAIESAIAQTYIDHEIIVIDDGSIDHTCQVVETFTDPRVRYFYQENRGLSAARNAGVQHALGEYIAFLDDDDFFLPEKLALQVPELDNQAEDVALIASGYLVVDSYGNVISEMRPWEWHPTLDLRTWLQSCPVIVNSVLIRKRWYELAGCSDETLGSTEDWDLWIRMSAAGARMDWLKEIVCAYEIHKANKSYNSSLNKFSAFQMYDKLFTSQSAPEDFLVPDLLYARVNVTCAASNYNSGYIEDAKNEIEAAIMRYPEFLSDNADQLFNLLVSWAGNPFVSDPITYLDIVFSNLPSSIDHLSCQKSKAFAQIYMKTFFHAHEKGDNILVWKMFVKAIQHDFTWIKNYGVISIIVKTIIGKSAHRLFKTALKKITR
jgi:glycosyltransferase involved in cell wall biosynthesis